MPQANVNGHLTRSIRMAGKWLAGLCIRLFIRSGGREGERESESEREATGYEPLEIVSKDLQVTFQTHRINFVRCSFTWAFCMTLSQSTRTHQFGGPGLFYAPTLTELYRGTSLIRNNFPLGPYSRPMSWVLWWSLGGGLFLMNEVPLYRNASMSPWKAFISKTKRNMGHILDHTVF